jgi:Ca2+-binding EF-hand superfamily protein
MVMRTTLSKKEFASALGMNEKDVFVMKMFNIVDRDGDGRISFQEFLDTIVLFSKVNKHKIKHFIRLGGLDLSRRSLDRDSRSRHF